MSSSKGYSVSKDTQELQEIQSTHFYSITNIIHNIVKSELSSTNENFKEQVFSFILFYLILIEFCCYWLTKFILKLRSFHMRKQHFGMVFNEF